MRLIDADALKENFPKDAKITIGHYTFIDHSVGIMFVRETIDNAPTIDAVEVVHGEWLRYGEDGNPNSIDTCIWQCDKCLVTYYGRTERIPNYCPNCGSKMDGEEKNDE